MNLKGLFFEFSQEGQGSEALAQLDSGVKCSQARSMGPGHILRLFHVCKMSYRVHILKSHGILVT